MVSVHPLSDEPWSSQWTMEVSKVCILMGQH